MKRHTAVVFFLLCLSVTATAEEIKVGDTIAVPGSIPGVLVHGKVLKLEDKDGRPSVTYRWMEAKTEVEDNVRVGVRFYHTGYHMREASLPLTDVRPWPTEAPTFNNQYFVLGQEEPNKIGDKVIPIVVLGRYGRVRYIDTHWFETRHRLHEPSEELVFYPMKYLVNGATEIPLYSLDPDELGLASSPEVRYQLLSRDLNMRVRQRVDSELHAFRVGMLRVKPTGILKSEQHVENRYNAIQAEFLRTAARKPVQRIIRACANALGILSSSQLETDLIRFNNPIGPIVDVISGPLPPALR